MRFSHEILPDFDFAICLQMFFKNVYGNGQGRRWDGGTGKDERDRGTQTLWPALLGSRKEKDRGESTWNFSRKKSGHDHEGSSFLPFFLE